MSYYDDYVSRVTSYGLTQRDHFSINTIEMANDKFTQSPYYRNVDINGQQVDIRFAQNQNYNQRIILFRPETKIDLGSYVTIDNQTWLLMDFYNNEIYPKSNAQLCNESLKWKTREGYIWTYPCSISKSRGIMNASGNSFDIQLPDGILILEVQLNDATKSIPLSLRMILNGRLYKITGIDNVSQTVNGKGTLKLTIQADTVLDNADDFTNGLADNSVLYGGSSAGSTPVNGGGQPW